MTRLARIVLGLLIALALAACGPGGGGTAQPAGSAPAASVPPADGY
jgi:hypothetical protein